MIFNQLPPAIMLLMVIEAVVLSRQPKARQQRLFPSLVAGLGLVMAWQCARTTFPVWIVLIPLSLALGAHVLDLKRRW